MAQKIQQVKKRDGRLVDFDPDRIRYAIHRAFIAMRQEDGELAEELTEKVIDKLPAGETPTIEDIQGKVIETLREAGYEEVADSYQTYQEEKKKTRDLKEQLGYKPDIKMSINALAVLRKRYLLKNEEGEVVETPEGMFERVARAIAEVEENYDDDPSEIEPVFYEMMCNLEFLPNSPTLFNANAPLGALSACFVLPVEDSLDSIFSTLKDMVMIEQGGGGVGFNFSRLRPEGDIVKSTKGVASGPVSFMKVFDTATEVIKQGGKRRGALMGILDFNHPDIFKFTTSKVKEDVFRNFNISVNASDDLMEAVQADETIELINPRTGKSIKQVRAREIWDNIVKSAWQTGDPGLIFIDEVNRHNPTPKWPIRATNPCGEQPLLPCESCNLGSINLTKMVDEENNDLDWDKLGRTVHHAVHFLDNVIDANKFPAEKIAEQTRANRKIGLGIMGFADMLIQLDIPYDSDEALELAEELMEFIQKKSKEKSVELGRKRGSFPNFEDSIWKEDYEAMRNATTTTIAPTGTISIIANCSSGIEPLFAISYIRNVLEGARLLEINPLFEKVMKDRGFYSSELLDKVSEKGSIQDMEDIPADVRELFKTALDINPEQHVKIQAAFQKHVDNSVSKTINLSEDAKLEQVAGAYGLAYELKCKGITVYRYGSKKEQVLEISRKDRIEVGPEYAGSCPGDKCYL